MKPVALSIAGSDPSGGAGIQADLKTFHQFGVYGEAVITLLTVQNTQRVSRVEVMPPELVEQQIRAVLEDIPPGAVKTGALGNAAMIQAVAALAQEIPAPLVVDPVMISKHGAALIAEQARTALLEDLLPRATLITPNLHEAAALWGSPVETLEQMHQAADALFARCGCAVLVKGGHLEGDAIDLLRDSEGFRTYTSPRFETVHTHGTGCTYSAAITASLARGLALRDAVAAAKTFIAEAIRTNPGLGGGSGPVNHHAAALQ